MSLLLLEMISCQHLSMAKSPQNQSKSEPNPLMRRTTSDIFVRLGNTSCANGSSYVVTTGVKEILTFSLNLVGTMGESRGYSKGRGLINVN